MWKAVFALRLVLFTAETSARLSCTNFGHEPGAYDEPNLLSEENSEMSYSPGATNYPPNKWFNDHVNTEVVNNSDACFYGDACLQTVGRDTITPEQNLYYRASYDVFEPGYTYVFNLFIKLTKSVHDLIQISSFSRSWYTQPSDHTKKAIYVMYSRAYHKVEDHWLLFSMDLKVTEQDMVDFKFVDFYLKVQDGTDYILDAASLTKVSYPDWEDEANENIAYYRMGSILFDFNISSFLDPNKVTVRVEQTRRHFPFGFAVNASVIGGDDSDPFVQKYRSWVEDRATWAVFLNAVKWRSMEWSRPDDTDRKFRVADSALEWLQSKNISVRGHAVHWNMGDRTPAWVAQQPDKKAEIDRRTNYVVTHYKGKFKHWDVCNEFTDSRLYQDWLGREDVLEYLHADVRRLDPDVQLFTNEWGNLQSRFHFSDSVSAILRLKEQQLIDGIGLQAHFKPQQIPFDIELIKRRLDIFAGLGLPIWITELTVSHTDPVIRASILADLLTLFYGTPAVHGILMWDFAPISTPQMFPCALAYRNLTNTAAGDKLDEMLAKWSTTKTIGPVCCCEDTISDTAFYGNYDITLLYDGVEKAKLPGVSLTPEQNVLHLNLVVDVGAKVTVS